MFKFNGQRASVNPVKRMRHSTTLAPLMEKDKNCLSLQYCKVVSSNMSWLEEHAGFSPSKFAFWVNLNPTLWVAMIWCQGGQSF